MIVRAATPADARAIAEVHVSSWRTAYDRIVPDEFLAGLSVGLRAKRWESILSAPDPRKFALVAGDPVVGFASGGNEREVDPRFTGEVYAIYLLAAFRGRGLGRALMVESARRLLALGHQSALVWVLAANPACRFYESLGGRVLRSKPIVIGGRRLEEVAYRWDSLRELTGACGEGGRFSPSLHLSISPSS